MSTFTVGPRIEFDTEGYPRLRAWNPETQREHYLYLHRLTAFAHGKLDSLADPRHVHHKDSDPWNGRPDNLQAVTAEEHDDLHEHRVIADGGLDPVDALEQHGPIYKQSRKGCNPNVVHLSETCNRLKGSTDRIDHKGQIPLRSHVCADCDPTQTIDRKHGHTPEIVEGDL